MNINNSRESIEEVDLSGFLIFGSITEEELLRMKFESICTPYLKGSVVYKEGSRLNGMYCIVKGIVKLYKTGIDGKEQIVRFATKGDIIAYQSLMFQETACTTSTIVEDAILFHIPFKNLINLVNNNPTFSNHLLRIACAELNESENYLIVALQKSVRERFAEVLLLLKKKFNLDLDQVIQISLTREELANIVGTAPEVVIKLLSEFKKDKMIDVQGRKIKIINLNKLKKVARVIA